VNRKECHYGGYHFRDRGKPEVFALLAKPEKMPGKSAVSRAFPLWRRLSHPRWGWFGAVSADA